MPGPRQDAPADRGETTDLAGQNPDVVKRLAAEYDAWWAALPPYLVNENEPGPKKSPFAELYREQFGAPLP